MSETTLTFVFVVGTSALTTFGVWLVARFTKGFDVYAGERAKLLAQSHNLELLVQQTQSLSALTETIKARITDELWDRQMRWTAKRDAYIRLMEALGERSNVEERGKLLETIHRREPHNPLYPGERDRALLRWQEVHSELVKAACSAPLLVSPDSHQILIDTTNALNKMDYDHPDFALHADHNLAVLQSALDNLLKVARKDLDAPTY